MTVMEQAISRVSLAVRMQDDFSREWFLVDKTKVLIKENGRTALENPGKYQVFTGVAETNVTVRIENKYYFAKEVAVNVPGLDSRNPVVAVIMKPNPQYPFPAGSTLVRGTLLDATSRSVAGASVTVDGSSTANVSDSDGRFLLYWRPLTEDDIAVVSQKRCVKAGGGTTIQLTCSHPSYHTKNVAIGTVVEGELKLLTTPIVLDPL